MSRTRWTIRGKVLSSSRWTIGGKVLSRSSLTIGSIVLSRTSLNIVVKFCQGQGGQLGVKIKVKFDNWK